MELVLSAETYIRRYGKISVVGVEGETSTDTDQQLGSHLGTVEK